MLMGQHTHAHTHKLCKRMKENGRTCYLNFQTQNYHLRLVPFQPAIKPKEHIFHRSQLTHQRMSMVKHQAYAAGIQPIAEIKESQAGLKCPVQTDSLTAVYLRGEDVILWVGIMADGVGVSLCEIPGCAVVCAGDVDLCEESRVGEEGHPMGTVFALLIAIGVVLDLLGGRVRKAKNTGSIGEDPL